MHEEAFHLKFQLHTKLNQPIGDITLYKALRPAENIVLKRYEKLKWLFCVNQSITNMRHSRADVT